MRGWQRVAMEILVLGGTAFLSRAVAEQARDRGHAVTCLARGTAPTPDGVTFVAGDRDHDDALAPVSGRHWDAVVDIAIFVDGIASNQGGVRRVVAANSAAVGQMIANWSIARSYNLTPGSHTVEVKVISADPNAAAANVSSATAPQLQGVLTALVLAK